MSKWPPPVQLAIDVVLRFQCNIADDRSTAGGARASSGKINKQETTNDSCIESSGSLAFCYNEKKAETGEFHDRTVLDQEPIGTCCPHRV